MSAVYNIEIDYMTGDSFGSEQQFETVDVVTRDLDTAKENLKRIKEHYDRYKTDEHSESNYRLELLTDTGTHTIAPFWVGYFEELHGAKIIVEPDPDTEFRVGVVVY